jgi:hypothetical protein
VALEDRGWTVAIAVILLAIAIAGFSLPRILAWPLAFALFWVAIASLYRVLAGRRSP